jgi:hypothetical protein
MARFNVTVESAAALSSSAPSGGTANGLFANLVNITNASSCKLRRVTLGVRAGVGAPTSQQVTVAVARTSARQTQTATSALNKLDPTSFTSNFTLDTTWTTVPTATWTAPYFYEVTFNTQSGVDLPWELLEEWLVNAGTGNGVAFFNVGNALPTSHLYTLALEIEE